MIKPDVTTWIYTDFEILKKYIANIYENMFLNKFTPSKAIKRLRYMVLLIEKLQEK